MTDHTRWYQAVHLLRDCVRVFINQTQGKHQGPAVRTQKALSVRSRSQCFSENPHCCKISKSRYLVDKPATIGHGDIEPPTGDESSPGASVVQK